MVVVQNVKPRSQSSCRRKEPWHLSENPRIISTKIIINSNFWGYQSPKFHQPPRMCQLIPNSRISLKTWQIKSRNSMTTTAWWLVCSRKSPPIVQLTFQRSMCWALEMILQVVLRQEPSGSAWVAPSLKRHRNCRRQPSRWYHRLPWILPWHNPRWPLTTSTIRWWYLIGAWHLEDRILLITKRILIKH